MIPDQYMISADMTVTSNLIPFTLLGYKIIDALVAPESFNNKINYIE